MIAGSRLSYEDAKRWAKLENKRYKRCHTKAQKVAKAVTSLRVKGSTVQEQPGTPRALARAHSSIAYRGLVVWQVRLTLDKTVTIVDARTDRMRLLDKPAKGAPLCVTSRLNAKRWNGFGLP